MDECNSLPLEVRSACSVDIFKLIKRYEKYFKIVNLTSVFRYLFSAVSVWDLIIILVLFKYHYYNFTICCKMICFYMGSGYSFINYPYGFFLFFVLIVVVFAIKL